MSEGFDDTKPESTLADVVRRAAARPDVLAAVASIYVGLQAEIEARKPRCDASGRCCHFDAYGHRLYITTLELAAFVANLALASPGRQEKGRVGLPIITVREPGCRYQIDGLCSVHMIRPFGCRIYFCDSTAQAWQQDLYEVIHERLKREHARLGVEYFYVEWRAALKQVLA